MKGSYKTKTEQGKNNRAVHTKWSIKQASIFVSEDLCFLLKKSNYKPGKNGIEGIHSILKAGADFVVYC